MGEVNNQSYSLDKQTRMGKTVLCLNNLPLNRTLDKSDDFYVGYTEGFNKAVAIMRKGNQEALSI